MNPFDLAALVGFVRIVVGISIVVAIGWILWERHRNTESRSGHE